MSNPRRRVRDWREHAARAILGLGLLGAAGCGPGSGEGGDERGFDPDTLPEAFARSTAALMAPGATRAFQITPEGDLFNGAWRIGIRPAAAESAASLPRAIGADERRWPVYRWVRHAAAVRFEFEAVAVPDRAPRDSALLASVRVRAENRGGAPAEARIEWTLEDRGSAPLFRVWDHDPAAESPAALRWAGQDGRAPAHARGEGDASGATLVTARRLGPGERFEARIVCATYPVPSATLHAFARRPHRAIVTEVRERWERALAGGVRLRLRDSEVERAFDAARIVLLSLRERRNGRWVPIGGPFHYRDVWLRDGARAIHALAVAGHTREARELAGGLEVFQWPNGAFLSQRGQLDGTGQALWAFEQAYLRPAPDAAGARRAAELAWRAIQWSENQRTFGRLTGWPFGRMLPFGEPRDAELVRAQLTGNDAWMLAGYRAAERLLRAAGRGADADSVAGAAAAYRQDFQGALARTGRPDIPPSWQNVGRDWGNLSAGYPCGALPPGDPRLHALAARAWREAGGAGLGFYARPDSLHGYNFADLASWALRAGERDSAGRMLDSLLRWRTASGGAAELFSGPQRDWGRNPPPHATSAAVLVDLVRNTLVFDEDDTLHLTLGARRGWWEGAAVKNAPTWWGLLDLEFGSDGREAWWRWNAVPVWTSLTLPPGFALAGGPPAPLQPGRNRTVLLAPPGTREARVRIERAESGR